MSKIEMPESLPADVGQAILALRAEFNDAIGNAITQALNAEKPKVEGDDADLDTVKDFIRTFHKEVKEAFAKQDYRLSLVEEVVGLKETEPGVPIPEHFPRKRGRPVDIKRDTNGKVVDTLLPLISARLQQAGMTTAQLAALLGVGVRSIYRWQKRESAPYPDVRVALARWINQVPNATDEQLEEWKRRANDVLENQTKNTDETDTKTAGNEDHE